MEPTTVKRFGDRIVIGLGEEDAEYLFEFLSQRDRTLLGSGTPVEHDPLDRLTVKLMIALNERTPEESAEEEWKFWVEGEKY